jgi:tetratricopeptide (TPR) repeat protein
MHAEATTAAARQAGDPRRTARALYALGVALQFRGETERAADVLEEGLQLARQAALPEQIASILNVLGDVRYARGDHQGAMALVEEGLALKRAAGDSIGAGVCLNMLGTMALNQRDLPRADACFSEALALFRPIGDRENVAVALLNLGNVARERGENGRAAALFREALVEFRDLGDLSGVAYSLEAMSAVAARTEHPEPAARWLGVAEAIRETIDEPIPIEQRESYTMAADQLRERLGETAFATLLQAGRMLAWENAAIEALALADELVASTGGQDQLHSDPRGSLRGADDVPLGQ